MEIEHLVRAPEATDSSGIANEETWVRDTAAFENSRARIWQVVKLRYFSRQVWGFQESEQCRCTGRLQEERRWDR